MLEDKENNTVENKRYYETRIINAINFINENLSEPLSIEQLAKQSHFSNFHFQRIYKALIGESPYETILRLRLEKSITLLKYEQDLKLNEIAFQVGFLSYENFSRQFKQRFKCTPKQFKTDQDLQNSRIYQEINPNDFYTRILESRKKELQKFDVKIEHLPNIKIALVKAIFGMDGSGLIEKYQHLMQWAEKNNIPYQGERKRFGMSIDNIEVTPSGQFRYDFALSLDQLDRKGEDIIEIGAIPEGQYATIHCQGKLENVAQAWDFLYKKWLPESDYKPKHYPALEEFVQGPEEIGWKNFNLKCRIPIEKI